MNLPLPAKKMKIWVTIVFPITVLLFAMGLPTFPVEAANPVKAVQISGLDDRPFVLDDQGNVWATSVSSRAYRMNLQPYRSHMMKAENMNGIISLSGQYALKDDGTVWLIRYVKSPEQDKDKWGLYTPKFEKQIPKLKNILKVTGLLALDRDGKLWAFDTFTRIIQEGNDFVEYPPLHEEPFLVQGVGRIKDIYGSTILKEDGTVWTWACHQLCHTLPEKIGTTPPTQIRGLENIVKVVGGDTDGIALKEDGTVWVWGYSVLAKPKSEKRPKNEAPFQLEGLSDIVDISYIGNHILALKKDGTVWTMGYFPNTKTGIYYPDNFISLHQIEGLADVIAVFSSQKTNAAIKKDGTLWMWGTDWHGLFGNLYGDPWALHDRPVQVELKPSVEPY